jgi:hypothetical protein
MIPIGLGDISGGEMSGYVPSVVLEGMREIMLGAAEAAVQTRFSRLMFRRRASFFFR